MYTLCHIACAAGVVLGACLSVGPAFADPPQHETRLEGALLKTHNVGSAEKCLSVCRENSDCTGFNFQLNGIADESGNIGPDDCHLMVGDLTPEKAKRITSCRMPCLASLDLPTGAGEVRSGLHEKNPAVADPEDDARKDHPNSVPAFGEISDPAPPPPAAPVSPGGMPVPPEAVPPSTPDQQAVVVPPSLPETPLRISGYQVAVGAEVAIPPLGVADAIAQCPSGKVAISAGFAMTPANPDAAFGLEIKGALPDGANGGFARVTFRNADIFAPASGHAVAVCIDRIVGMRNIDASLAVAPASCTSGERLIGGGVMGHFSQHMRASTPLSDGSRWLSAPIDPIASRSNFTTRTICAPANRVDGLEWTETPNANLSARGVTPISLSCPSGKVTLAAGFFIEPALTASGNAAQAALRAGDIIAGLVRNLEPADQSGSQWTMELRNRNIAGAPGSVRGRLQAICAPVQ